MTINIFFNLLSLITSLLLAFFISPMILRKLGDTRYGVWALFGELLSYYGLFDFGVRSAVDYFVGRSLAAGEDVGVRRYTSSAIIALIALATLLFLATAALLFVFKDTFVPQSTDRFEVIAAAMAFVLLFCIGLPLDVFASVLVGSRRAFIVSSAETVARIVASALMLVGLTYAPGLLVLCAAQFAGKLIYWTVVVKKARQHVPQAVLQVPAATWDTVRQMLRYGTKNSIIGTSWLLANRKDVVLTTIFLGPQWVATYTFARLIIDSLTQTCGSITQAVRPNLVYHWARQEYEHVYSIYYTIARYSAFVVLMPTAFLICFGRDFLALWIGSRFVEGSWWFRTDVVLFILLAAQAPRMMHSISWQLLFATNRQKSLSILIAADAAVNVALALWLVRYGTVGLAIATLVPMFISHVVILPVLMQKLVGVSFRRYVTEGIGRSVISASAVTAIGLVLHQMLPAQRWSVLLLNAAIMAAISFTLGAIFIIRPSDRTALLTRLRALLNPSQYRAGVSQT